MKLQLLFVALALGIFAAIERQGSAQEQFPFQIFERYIGLLIPNVGMPGLSAVIVQDDRIVWSKNYGFADGETGNWLAALADFRNWLIREAA